MGTYVRTQSIDHAIGERGTVSLTLTSGDVRAHAIPGGEAHVRATFQISASSDAEADRLFEDVQLHVQRGPDDLTMTEPEGIASVGALFGRLLNGRGHHQMSLVAEVPSNANLRLTGISSEMEVNGMRGEQRYRTVSGDLLLSELGGSIQLQTVSGDATVHGDLPLSLDAQSVSGDITITAPTLQSLRANTVSGDVELEAELAASGEFRVETVSGDLVVGLAGSATFEVHGLSTDVSCELDHRLEGSVDRRRLIIGKGGPSLRFNSMSGDVDVRRPRRISTAGEASDPQPSAPDQASQLEVLRALERGEIDVDEATRRLGGT